MITIENEQIIAKINEQGAELTSVQNKDDGYEYIWNDKAWPKHAPILFPAIGRSVDDQYLIDGKKYEMPQHGFAALYKYEVVEKTENSVTFSLTDNQETLAMYPFHFNLTVKFELNNRDLQVSFEVENKNTQELSFSLGFHPAFNIPMASSEKFEDYSLELLPTKSTLQQYEIVKTPNPYRSGKVVDFVESGSTFKLNRKIFEKGLVIFDEDIDEVRLFSKEHQVGVIMNDFSNLCIWTKEDTELPFLCIEPFYGLPDQVNKMQELTNKTGNYHLKADSNALFNCTIKF